MKFSITLGTGGEGREPAALAALAALAVWTGTPVRHHGRDYRLDGAAATRQARAAAQDPIWVGGDLRRPGVRRRLTRWDGVPGDCQADLVHSRYG